MWGWIGGLEEDVVWGRLFEFCDPIGVVCARYQLRIASDSDGVKSGVDLWSPGNWVSGRQEGVRERSLRLCVGPVGVLSCGLGGG